MAIDLGDPHTFRRAFADHERSVYAAAFRVLGNSTQAQDVVQDVFLRVWRRPGAYDERRGELGAYLRLMARSRALDLWREAQAAGRATDRMRVVAVDTDAPVDTRPFDATSRHEIRAMVREALSHLPELQREALVLAYWGGLTADEIAGKVAIPLGTAKSRIRLGLARLRNEDALAHAV